MAWRDTPGLCCWCLEREGGGVAGCDFCCGSTGLSIIIIVLVLETCVWGSTWPTYRQDVCRIVGALSGLESTNSHLVPMGI